MNCKVVALNLLVVTLSGSRYMVFANPKSVISGKGTIPRVMIFQTDQSSGLGEGVIYRSPGITVHESRYSLSVPERPQKPLIASSPESTNFHGPISIRFPRDVVSPQPHLSDLSLRGNP